MRPGDTCVSKRAGTLKAAYRRPLKGRITDLAIDATGLNAFGEGEWKVRKHGNEKRRVWQQAASRGGFCQSRHSGSRGLIGKCP